MQYWYAFYMQQKFYMIGRDKNRTFWRVLKIDRLELSELNIIEDPTKYSEIECYDLLRRIHEGNKRTGGLKFVTTCYGIIGMLYLSHLLRKTFVQCLSVFENSWCFLLIIGFIKFLGPYYMLLITKRRKIGAICGHAIYSIAKSEILPIPNSTVRSEMANSKNENRSFVHFACKCNMSLVLLRRPKRVAIRIIDCPYVLEWGFCYCVVLLS